MKARFVEVTIIVIDGSMEDLGIETQSIEMPCTFDVNEVSHFAPFDHEDPRHTHVDMKNGDELCVKMTYAAFKDWLESVR